MAAPKVSVVVPVYNRMHTLPRAVASVLAQTEPDFELIIIDEASTDGTQEYLAGLGDPRVRAIGRDPSGQARRLGVAAGRNLGLQAARADFVAFLDSDDAYLPERLAVPLAVLRREPDVVCAVVSARKQLRNRTDTVVLPNLKLTAPVAEWACYADLFPIECTALTVRRDAALAIGGFSTAWSLSEDREIMLRLSPRGAVRLLPDVLWEKSWSTDGLSMQWSQGGRGLLAYLDQCPAYRTRYPKIASYLTTRALVADVRNHLWAVLWRDLREFRAAGLLSGGPLRLWRNHREVRRYRRRMSKQDALASITDPPQSWF